MADAVTSQTLVDGERNVVMKFTNLSDGTGESAVLKVDVSALSGSPSSVSIQRIIYSVFGMNVTLLWDATTDVRIVELGGNTGTLDFCSFGGLQNNAGAGVTGDILLTTTGHTSGDSYSIILEMRKN
jgi:hypothetical protein